MLTILREHAPDDLHLAQISPLTHFQPLEIHNLSLQNVTNAWWSFRLPGDFWWFLAGTILTWCHFKVPQGGAQHPTLVPCSGFEGPPSDQHGAAAKKIGRWWWMHHCTPEQSQAEHTRATFQPWNVVLDILDCLGMSAFIFPGGGDDIGRCLQPVVCSTHFMQVRCH